MVQLPVERERRDKRERGGEQNRLPELEHCVALAEIELVVTGYPSTRPAPGLKSKPLC